MCLQKIGRTIRGRPGVHCSRSWSLCPIAFDEATFSLTIAIPGAIGSLDFLFGAEELREKCVYVSGGFECRPVCKDCFEKEMTIVHRGKTNTTQERKEKEQKEKEKQKKKQKSKQGDK